MQKLNPTDWSVPQRQPWSSLFILIVETFWEILKRIWPVLLIPIFRGFNDNSGRTFSRIEFYALIILALTLAGGLLKYLFFKFHILNGELIVKKGWIKKQTIVIPLENIQAVNLEQPMLHQAMNLVKVTIDTAGSSNAEVSIDSLSKPMAEELRARLVENSTAQEIATDLDALRPKSLPIIRISTNDLFRLSISANHLETFFLILAFGLSIYDDLSGVSEGFAKTVEGLVPKQTFSFIIFLLVASLIVTILISSFRIFLKFYNLTVYESPSGFRVTSGLTTIKERLISLRRVQYISWRANWIRQLLKLKVLRFHLTGDDNTNEALKAELAVTREEYLLLLTNPYHPIPGTEGKNFVTIHPSFVVRRTVLIGIIPALVFVSIAWFWLQENSLFALFFPLLILLLNWLHVRKFRLYAFDHVVFIQKGLLGKEAILLKWQKIQSVRLKQSIYQRRAGLANIVFVTAGAEVMVRYIPLPVAHQLVNYALFRIESSNEPWM